MGASERSQGTFTNFNKWRATAAVVASTATLLAATGEVGVAPAKAESSATFNFVGTNGGRPGVPAMDGGINITYNLTSPGLTDYQADMREASTNLNNAINNTPEGTTIRLRGYSKGADALVTFMQQHPETLWRVDSATVIEESCGPMGIRRNMPEAQLIAGQCGPEINPYGPGPHIDEWEVDRSPITHYHTPVSLLDAAGEINDYLVYHPLKPETLGPYSVSEWVEGRITHHEIHTQ